MKLYHPEPEVLVILAEVALGKVALVTTVAFEKVKSLPDFSEENEAEEDPLCDGWLASGHFLDADSFWRMSLYDALLVLKGIGNHTENMIQMQNIYQGNLLAMILNTTPKKTRKVYKWSDFYPDTREKKEMTNEEIAEKLHRDVRQKRGMIRRDWSL